eukprot:scaffold178308_cov36-Tisochrysis_lutea.AAC.2
MPKRQDKPTTTAKYTYSRWLYLRAGDQILFKEISEEFCKGLCRRHENREWPCPTNTSGQGGFKSCMLTHPPILSPGLIAM